MYICQYLFVRSYSASRIFTPKPFNSHEGACNGLGDFWTSRCPSPVLVNVSLCCDLQCICTLRCKIVSATGCRAVLVARKVAASRPEEARTVPFPRQETKAALGRRSAGRLPRLTAHVPFHRSGSCLLTVSGLLRADVLALLGHRTFHEEHQNDE